MPVLFSPLTNCPNSLLSPSPTQTQEYCKHLCRFCCLLTPVNSNICAQLCCPLTLANSSQPHLPWCPPFSSPKLQPSFLNCLPDIPFNGNLMSLQMCHTLSCTCHFLRSATAHKTETWACHEAFLLQCQPRFHHLTGNDTYKQCAQH